MDEQYGDGSDHKVCEGCGNCADCGDGDKPGCGTTRSQVIEYEYDELIGIMKDSVCTVRFVKADGSIRDMICTLHESFLPPKKENTRPMTINKKSIRVFDLEKEGWRSFRLDSIRSVIITEKVSA